MKRGDLQNLKKSADRLMNTKGRARGAGMKSYGAYILVEEGEKGLKELEAVMGEIGYPIKYKEIKTLGFYPIGMEAVTFVSIQLLFDYDEEKFRKMGGFELSSSLLMKIFMKYFISLEKAAEELPRIWEQHFSLGSLKVIELNKEKGYLTVRLTDFCIHPLHCTVLIGVLVNAVRMITKCKEVACEETKCMHRGDDCHEFLLKWRI
ncbi:MAG: hypothetical protein GF370_00105 [Candidatus Nealsonbacteria bacterium]|nr:hypothetical protein [Candidatus Nealsonbacteria bacterium]